MDLWDYHLPVFWCCLSPNQQIALQVILPYYGIPGMYLEWSDWVSLWYGLGTHSPDYQREVAQLVFGVRQELVEVAPETFILAAIPFGDFWPQFALFCPHSCADCPAICKQRSFTWG